VINDRSITVVATDSVQFSQSFTCRSASSRLIPYLLDLPDELIALATDLRDSVVRQLACLTLPATCFQLP
jgi:hypothetical protein